MVTVFLPDEPPPEPGLAVVQPVRARPPATRTAMAATTRRRVENNRCAVTCKLPFEWCEGAGALPLVVPLARALFRRCFRDVTPGSTVMQALDVSACNHR